MLPLHDIPDQPVSVTPIVRGTRWVARTIRRRHLEESLNWLGWLLAVAAFALWTLAHNHPSARPSWVGMMIRISVFATWMLVVREWIALRLMRCWGQQPDSDTDTEQSGS
jgi:hypothetical protein